MWWGWRERASPQEKERGGDRKLFESDALYKVSSVLDRVTDAIVHWRTHPDPEVEDSPGGGFDRELPHSRKEMSNPLFKIPGTIRLSLLSMGRRTPTQDENVNGWVLPVIIAKQC